jgi:16S rRNA (cytidine1402-2'-O)-methyltransferase
MSGTLFVVATPIGNLEDITARALRVLREASVIAAEDTRRTSKLLARYAITTPTTSLHEHNERQKSRAILDRLERGQHVALVSDAGTPTVSDPGQSLIRDAIEAGIRVESIPGPSAVIAALAASGFASDSFTFLGFPPARSTDRSKWFERLRAVGGTVVFFEAPHRIRRTLEELRTEVGDIDVLVARELTKIHEELVRGPISGTLGRLEAPLGEFTVVANIGRKTNIVPARAFSPEVTVAEICRMTESGAISRRQAVSSVAKKYSKPTNELYRALENAKRSAE